MKSQNQKIKIKENSLAETNPILASEWNYEKNYPLTPHDISAGHRNKVWWKCSLGHEWEAIVSSRNRKGDKCPVCAGRKLLVGFNDLATTHPHLVKYWDYEKNYPLIPQMVTKGQGLKVYWICEQGHSTFTRIADKAKYGTCSECSKHNYRSINADNDSYLIKFSNIASEWDYEKNKDLKNSRGIDISTPDKIKANSHITVWWKCNNGHEWPDIVRNRTKTKNSGCPYCNSSIIRNKAINDVDTIREKIKYLKGKSILDKYPDVCKEWDYNKNLPLIPEIVTDGTETMVYWICSNKHSYIASVTSKINGMKCPYCSGRKKLM